MTRLCTIALGASCFASQTSQRVLCQYASGVNACRDSFVCLEDYFIRRRSAPANRVVHTLVLRVNDFSVDEFCLFQCKR